MENVSAVNLCSYYTLYKANYLQPTYHFECFGEKVSACGYECVCVWVSLQSSSVYLMLFVLFLTLFSFEREISSRRVSRHIWPVGSQCPQHLSQGFINLHIVSTVSMNLSLKFRTKASPLGQLSVLVLQKKRTLWGEKKTE